MKIANAASLYTSEAVKVDARAQIKENLLHYFVVVPQDGFHLLVPTQGKLVMLNEGKDFIHYVYIRWHRRPEILAYDKNNHLVRFVHGYEIPEGIKERVTELAQTEVVYDRRHMRIDDGEYDYPTPGVASEASEGYHL